jgi:flavin reductase (DIM6/NTAB) family NADH-FMN oxidoreductase RutF
MSARSQSATLAESRCDGAALRRALGSFVTGVTVVTARCEAGGRPTLVGLTVNSFSSVSLDPPLVLWSMKRSNPNLRLMQRASHYAVNVLAQAQADLCRHFAQPRPDRFAEVSYDEGLGGAPLLPASAASFECRQHAQVDGGDHVIFIGRVERFRRAEAEPLIFYDGGHWGLDARCGV